MHESLPNTSPRQQWLANHWFMSLLTAAVPIAINYGWHSVNALSQRSPLLELTPRKWHSLFALLFCCSTIFHSSGDTHFLPTLMTFRKSRRANNTSSITEGFARTTLFLVLYFGHHVNPLPTHLPSLPQSISEEKWWEFSVRGQLFPL